MNKFSSNIDYLRQYVNGELSSSEMYEIERTAQEDEMLMDIIEGLETERDLHISTPIMEIKNRIQHRTRDKKNTTTKIFTLKKLTIAASIVIVLGISALFLFKPQPSPILVATDEKPLEQNTVDNSHVDTSSTQIVQNDKENVEIVSKNTDSNLIAKNKVDKTVVTPTEPQIIAYVEPKNKVLAEISIAENKVQDLEEIIVIQSRKEIIPQKTELLSANMQSASTKSIKPTSIAKTQADLQKMNLDPQSKAALEQVLARQSLETTIDIKDKKNENSLGEIVVNDNSLAMKRNRSKEIDAAEIPSFAPTNYKELQNGIPSSGWIAFNAYIKKELAKKGINKYIATISFELDASKKPTNIEILSPSDSTINKHLLKIIQNGPKWERTDDKKPIYIHLKSGETNQ